MRMFIARAFAVTGLLASASPSLGAGADRPQPSPSGLAARLVAGSHDESAAFSVSRRRRISRRQAPGPSSTWSAPCFQAQGNVSTVDPQTYLYYIQLRPSSASRRRTSGFRTTNRPSRPARADFSACGRPTSCPTFRSRSSDYTFSNGVVGKLVAYNMEERERVKIVNYEGTKQIDRTKIDEQLRARGIELRLDSFLDQSVIRRVETVLREMMAEKGFTNAEVSHTFAAVAGGPKLINVTFQVDDGPEAEDPRHRVRRQHRDERRHASQEDEGQQDAESLLGLDYARRHLQGRQVRGRRRPRPWPTTATRDTCERRSASPRFRTLQDSARPQDPVDPAAHSRSPKDQRYRVGDFSVAGNTVVKSEALTPLFKVKTGDWYNEKEIRDGLDQGA